MSQGMAPVAGAARKPLALAALVLMGMLWGSTFFSMKDLTTRIPVPDLLAVRFMIAAAALGLLAHRHWRMSRTTLWQGTVLGLIYGSAQLVQTVGLAHTAASVSGFVTGLYVVITPFLAAWLLRERIPALTWLAVVLAAAGLGMLTLDLSAGVRIGHGELLTLVSAVMYACHIVAVDRWSTRENSISLTLVTLTVVALECTLAALPGGIQAPSGRTDWLWMMHIALIAGAIPILLQVWAQAVVESTTAAVLMAGEPVWAAVFAVLLGGEVFTWQMGLGGGSMFAAMILVTILPRLRR
ncbi:MULTISPECIES: DMT family transporter [Luteococcus]|nr:MULTISPECIES: DMT family transporter [Luteococcus]MDN5562599.1 DMT family transporter [Luteococcus sp.]